MKYNIGVQDDVHSWTSIAGDKPIVQFLNAIMYTGNSTIIKSVCCFPVPVK